jgi:hypothetical protein
MLTPPDMVFVAALKIPTPVGPEKVTWSPFDAIKTLPG